MRVSREAVDLIAEFEGGQSSDGLFHPYYDRWGGVWTIGYGHTEDVHPGSHSLTQEQAKRLLETDLDKKYAKYVDALHLPLNQNQYDALVDIAYNLGPGYLSTQHDLGIYLERHDWKRAADSMLEYVHAGGVVLAGLVRRRKADRALFLKPALTRDQQKVAKWETELSAIRDYIHAHGGHWDNHPIRKARAEELKAAIKRHGGKS